MTHRLILIGAVLLAVVAPQRIHSAEESEKPSFVRTEQEEKEVVALHDDVNALCKDEMAINPELYRTEEEKENLRYGFTMAFILNDAYAKFKGEAVAEKELDAVADAMHAEFRKGPEKDNTVPKQHEYYIEKVADLVFAEYLKANPERMKDGFESEGERKAARGYYVMNLWFKNLPEVEFAKFSKETSDFNAKMARANKELEQAATNHKIQLAAMRREIAERDIEEAAKLEAFIKKMKTEQKSESDRISAIAEEKERAAKARTEENDQIREYYAAWYNKHEDQISKRLKERISNEMETRVFVGLGALALEVIVKKGFQLLKDLAIDKATGGGLAGKLAENFVNDTGGLQWPELMSEEERGKAISLTIDSVVDELKSLEGP